MKLVFATNNQHKVKEIRNLLPDFIELLGLDDIHCKEDIPETSDTIAGNASQKARYISEKYACDCFADDTGLEIESLNGEPGIYSARYAGEQKSAEDNMDKVLHRLDGKLNRRAQFKTVIALIINGKETLFEGIVKGSITTKRSGFEGFGYDPIFKPDGYDCTFSEMSMEEKNKISHRGKAVKKLTDYLNSL